jgi:hypothetical protein
MTVNKYLLPLFTLLALLGSFAVAQATGNWSISGKDNIDVNNLTSGDEVRGWMTLQNLSDGFGIQPEEMYLILDIPTDIPLETALKDMEGILPDFEVTDVREALDDYLGIAPPPEEQTPDLEITPAPDGAVSPETNPTPLPVAHTPLAGDGEGGSGTGPTLLPPGQILPASEIKGRHTLQEIADQCQVPLPDLLAGLGLPENFDADTQVKDLIGSGNVAEVQNVRDVVSGLQNP